MILTCPQCATRYLLPAHTLGQEGRRVKCSECSEMWFQLPDSEELKAQSTESFEEIPEGVKPLPEGANLPTVQEQTDEVSEDKAADRTRLMGYAAAVCVFFAVLGILIGFRGFISEALPISQSLYALMGYEKENPVLRLVFDSLQAKATSDAAGEKIEVTGKILNPMDYSIKVPPIKAEIRDKDGKVLESWIVNPPVSVIEARSDFFFGADSLHAVLGESFEVYLTFSN